jgi:hypothetical protein
MRDMDTNDTSNANASSRYYPLGAVGTLMQWTLDDGTVITNAAGLDAAMRVAVEAGQQEVFDLLCEVSDHWGQRATLLDAHPDDQPRPTLVVRFADGYDLFCWTSDVWFD